MANKVLPLTPKSNKRILSNSSISPKHDDKKSKLFVSPNRFAVLSSDDPSDCVFEMPPNISTENNKSPDLVGEDVEPAAPPIYIENITNFSRSRTN